MKNNTKLISSFSQRAKKEMSGVNKFILTIVIFIISITIFTCFLRIPYILNTELTYNLIFYVNLASILIFSAGIMFRPWTALFTCVVGSVLGELCYCLIFGCGESLPAYLIFMVVSPGLAGALISVVHQKLKPGLIKEIIAMIIGAIWQYLGLVVGAYIYYEIIISFFHWQLYAVYIFYPLYLTVYGLLLIPLSVILNIVLKHIFKVKYFDDLLEIPFNS
jgi:hypothetical protein